MRQTTVSGWETSGEPAEAIVSLCRLCDVLGTTPNHLLGYAQEPEGIAANWFVVDEDEFERLKAGGRRIKGEHWAFPIPVRYRLAHSVAFVKMQAELEEARTRKPRK